jgi:hypothetical protein
MSEATNINEILKERGKTHGDYTDHAAITQSLKHVITNRIVFRGSNVRTSLLGYNLEADCLETIDMIFHKIGRIVAGNPNVEDHWRDIAGYATLVADRLKKHDEAYKNAS